MGKKTLLVVINCQGKLLTTLFSCHKNDIMLILSFPKKQLWGKNQPRKNKKSVFLYKKKIFSLVDSHINQSVGKKKYKAINLSTNYIVDTSLSSS